MNHDKMTEKAAFHALGLLGEEEVRELTAHAAGCQDCMRELAAMASVAGALAGAATQVEPGIALREKLMAQALPARAEVLPGIVVVRGGRLSFEESGIPGVSVKPLFVDQAKGYRTSVVTMAPGTWLPRHRHAGVEEVFMLSGDFSVEGQTLGPGDYCRAEGATVHEPGFTKGGCTILVVASMSDDYSLAPAGGPEAVS